MFRLNRDTVRKTCLYSAPQEYRLTKTTTKPKLGPLLPVIDAILAADREASGKQQHTAKRIFERLRDEHGYLCAPMARLARSATRLSAISRSTMNDACTSRLTAGHPITSTSTGRVSQQPETDGRFL